MINVSDEFRTLMQIRTDFKQNAVVTTIDGQIIELDESDFTIDNNSVTDSAGSGALPLGSAVARTIQIEIMNDTGKLADTALMGAKIRLYLTFQLSETIEKIEYGTFTVIEPETYGETVIISAIDDMYKADKEYITGLSFPQSAGAVFRDICDNCGLLYSSAQFANHDFIINERPEGLTCREALGYVAQIAAGNARVNRFGRVEIITYDLANIAADRADTHRLSKWINLKIDTDDVVITGMRATKEVEDADGNISEEIVTYGVEGYILSIENPLIAGRTEDALQRIGDILIGGRIRKFSGDHIAYPLAEFGDKAVIFDRRGNSYQTVITDIDFVFFGMTTMENSTEPAIRNSSKYNNSKAQAIIAAKELVDREKTQREIAMGKLNETIANSSGMYLTEERQPDGSTIYYWHDKPTLAESQNVMKLTADAIGLSTDGGETYPFGFTLDGEMVMQVIATEGLNADWINTGAFIIKDNSNNIIFQADVDTKTLVINTRYFTLDSTGKITATSGKFSGEIECESGTIGGFTVEKNRLFSESGHGVELNTLSGTVSTGDLTMRGAGGSMGTIGITANASAGSYLQFREDSAATYGISLFSSTGKIGMRDDVDFLRNAHFEGNVTFKNPPFSAIDAWPVGSIFLSVTFTNPKTLLGGGTWEQLPDRFLIGTSESSAGSFPNGSTGGAKTHTLDFDEMPNHTHEIATYAGGVNGSGGAVQRGYGGSTALSKLETGSAGGSSGVTQPFSIMPPYLAVFMWKRIS